MKLSQHAIGLVEGDCKKKRKAIQIQTDEEAVDARPGYTSSPEKVQNKVCVRRIEKQKPTMIELFLCGLCNGEFTGKQ